MASLTKNEAERLPVVGNFLVQHVSLVVVDGGGFRNKIFRDVATSILLKTLH